ncbi:Gfo/Idh/MocA family oxidoreductase [Sphingomonas sp.]|uniref:Gfo/Idh/MocA family oxidoreductase n=1 Tax=Sphingomonas sp. TaxID=28214 RepID=UPI003B3A7A4B
MTIDTALIGFGQAGARIHAPLLLAEPSVRLRRIITSRRDEARASCPDVVATKNVGDALNDPSIGLVVIATPNHTHIPFVRDALLSGKHVVVDKPFVTDEAEGRDLVRLARERGQMLTVFHNRRWDGDFLTVRRMIQSGRLGSVRLAEFRWDRFRPAVKAGWRELPGEGTGLLADLGPHLVDQALLLFGMPDYVGGDIAIQRGGALVDDYFELTLHYGAMRVILSASTLVAAPRPRFALHGDDGSFVKHGLDPQEALLRSGRTPRDAGFGEDETNSYGVLTRTDGSGGPIPTERGNWRAFYRAVVEAIDEAGPAPVDPTDALAGLAVIDHALRSAREGRLLRFVLPAYQ